ncbi:acyl-CoA reductase [Pectobacterium cacticida]|uniref:Acyl-CoA reductase n=1 Tax=Pectobacterium cacticida TaxID=69221 RepID=A0ABZ2G6Q2_9GAMM|nr:acyl-CoA reductase [Pectobacterium cacticida]UYX05473.1 acyl-CoA reductase [Pectobacterium cacticida]
MQNNFDGISFLVGNESLMRDMTDRRTFKPFDENVVAFLDNFSKRLFNNPLSKAWPDVISLAFWCRKSSVLQMKKAYPDLSRRMGRGLAFHIAPSNVAVNFAYSLIVGLLSGNANIVRVPSRDFPQVALICDELNATLREQNAISPYICLVRYGREKVINDILSGWCQTRLIWGGDETIATIRQSQLPPRGLDLAFANRYSLALIDAGSYLSMPDKRTIAERFYNDTFLTDQNACTSPGLVVWLGEQAETEKARAQFWLEFETFSQERYELQAVMAVRKLTQFCTLSASMNGIKKASDSHNLVFRVLLDKLDERTMDHSGSGGYFLEYLARDVDDIYPICNNSRCQTLSVLGIDVTRVEEFLADYQPKGIDRVIPMGRTMEFGLQWDGYDLINILTRCVVI